MAEYDFEGEMMVESVIPGRGVIGSVMVEVDAESFREAVVKLERDNKTGIKLLTLVDTKTGKKQQFDEKQIESIID